MSEVSLLSLPPEKIHTTAMKAKAIVTSSGTIFIPTHSVDSKNYFWRGERE
jgi:hypothetical protein